MVVPKLVASYKLSETTNKANYLTALAHIVKGVPHTVLVPQLPQVLIC